MDSTVVYGPPGCGKTSFLVDVLSSCGGSDFLFVSFTKAAALEAVGRVGSSACVKDSVCTLHSLAFRLCGLNSGVVVDGPKLKKFGARTGFSFKGSSDVWSDIEVGDAYRAVISRAVNRESSLAEEYHNLGRPGNWAEFEFFCRSYSAWKFAHGYLDFDDMLLRYLADPVPHGASVVIVDEAQDLSNLQWRVVSAIVSQESVKRVVVAGDDDQAVFEWAGANPGGMARFEALSRGERVVLSQSWRVPGRVHALAQGLISRVKNRVPKEYLAKASQGVVERASSFTPNLVKGDDDVMILCRNFHVKAEVEKELARHLIPYRVEGGVGLFDSRLARGVSAFNALIGGDRSKVVVSRVAAVATSQTKLDLESGAFDVVAKRGFLRSLIIPLHLIDFYKAADLSVAPKVRLSTIHSAKGREANHVILHTGLTAKTLIAMDSDMDAETRVWYVGVTRAKNKLTILEGDMGFKV